MIVQLTRRGWLGIGLACLLARGALADAVYTVDGSKLVGRIERMGGAKLVLVSAVAGRLEIDTAQIQAIEVDQPLTVEFQSGDRLVGTIAVSADEGSSVMRSALGEVSVDPKQIASIYPVGGESPAEQARRAEIAQAREAVRPKWSISMEAGGSRTEGNTDTLEARGRLDVVRKTEDDLLNFYLAAKYYEQNDQRSTNEYRGGIRYESALNERWYWYARTALEFDEFEDLDLRTTAAAGVGHYWIKRPDHELKNSVGLGYRHESYNTGVTDDQFVLDLTLDYRLDLAPWAQFTHSATYSPDIEDTDNYRLDFDTGLLFPLKDDRFKLKLGMSHEYSSRPQPGLDRLDTTYYANLVLQLKDVTR